MKTLWHSLFLLVFSLAPPQGTNLTEPQKQELTQKFGDARVWDVARMKEATLKIFLPASTAFFSKSDKADDADYPYVWIKDGKASVSRPVDGFLNAGESVRVGVARIEKDSVRFWIGRNVTNDAVNVRAFLVIPFNTYEQLTSQINQILTVQ